MSKLLTEAPVRERIKHLAHALAQQRNPLGRLQYMPDGVSDDARVRASATLAERGIQPYRARDLYLRGPHFEYEAVTRFWDEKLQESQVCGHSGMCASGDAFWLKPRDWKTFLDYEADLNNLIADKPITLLCTYPLSVCKAGDILDVARAHQVAPCMVVRSGTPN